ncbi:hypothetical protein NQ315_017195 [Exocentrus adspersus]|uniref:Proteasome endopeptidase complex n=1 Tax=Exocentrus adspersus TaxID=1586481 RepID=A0AAV8V8B2_9CUCU|nr:hypothetical protein NQ315_017195 [Exocentrus adspersus]
MYCAGAGTAADTDRVTRMVEKYLNLFKAKYNKEGSVFTAKRIIENHLFYYCGYIGAALILGGSLAAMGVLEKDFKINMSEEEAVSLGIKAIEAGIMNDLYSGSQVDYLIINQEGSIK